MIEQTFTGRGCLAVSSTDEGIDILIQQDGTSDWSISRLMAWIGDIAGGVFGNDTKGEGMAGPSDSSGCNGVVEDSPEREEFVDEPSTST